MKSRKIVCENCKEKLDYRPHRRIMLCEKCYAEKRKNDVAANHRKLRTGSKEKVVKLSRNDNDPILGNLKIYLASKNIEILYSYTPMENKDPDDKDGFIVLKGKHSLPVSEGWNIEFLDGNTKLSYHFEYEVKFKRLELHCLLIEYIKYIKLHF